MVINPRKWVGYSLFRLITLVGAIVALQACSAFKSDALLFIDVARQSVSAGPVLPTPSTGLDLKYRYLMVQVVGEPAAMLVLSTEYNTPNGLLEVWVAADGNLVQTLNGRLASAAGLSTQWSSVRWIGVPVEDAGSVVFGSVA